MSEILPYLSFGVAVLGIITVWIWNVWNKASTVRSADRGEIKKEYENVLLRMDKIVAESTVKFKDLDAAINSLKDHLADTKSEFGNRLIQFSLEALKREEANSMIEEKLKPLRDALLQVKDDIRESKQDQKQILSELHRLIISVEGYKRRRDDE